MKSREALAILTVCLGLFIFKLKIDLFVPFMLMHLVNNLVKKELQEKGLALTTRRRMQWT